MKKLFKLVLTIVLVSIFFSTCFATEEKEILEGYKILQKNENYAEDTKDIALGLAYVGESENWDNFELPKKYKTLSLKKINAEGKEVYLLVPKYAGTGILVAKGNFATTGRGKEVVIKKVYENVIDTPLLVFCNSENLPYETYIEVYDIMTSKVLARFILHRNKVSNIPVLPSNVLDYTLEI